MKRIVFRQKESRARCAHIVASACLVLSSLGREQAEADTRIDADVSPSLASKEAAAVLKTIYVAQLSQGAGDGSSCASARAASWFNSGVNWGSGSTQIAPGTMVRLCGAVSTNLTFQSSGASGAPIVVDGTGASYSGTFSNGSGRSWWQVQNVRWADGYGSTLMMITGGSNGVFTGNHADNVSGGVFLAQYNGATLPDRIVISNNFIRTTASDLGNTQHDIIATEGSTRVTIEGNHLEMRAGGSGSNAHNDVIQTWEKGGTSAGGPADWTVRHNRIVMNSAVANDRSWMMLESLSGTINIVGNEFIGLRGAGEANGISASGNRSDAVFNIYNNTFVSKASASNNVLNLSGSGVANLRNNIFHTVWQTALTGTMARTRANNLWYGSNIPSCQSSEICGRDPQFVDYANNQFGLAAGSPAIDSGLDLGAAYAGYVLPSATWPNPTLVPRPAGAWNIGAH